MPNHILHHRGIYVVVVNPLFFAGVVWRVNVDAFDFSRVERQERFQRFQVVTMNNQIVVEAYFVSEAFLFVRDKLVILDEQVVILNELFPLNCICAINASPQA